MIWTEHGIQFNAIKHSFQKTIIWKLSGQLNPTAGGGGLARHSPIKSLLFIIKACNYLEVIEPPPASALLIRANQANIDNGMRDGAALLVLS